MHKLSPTASFEFNHQRSAAQVAPKRRVIQLIPLLIVFYAVFLLPPEVEFSVLGINLPSYRIALLAVSLPALWSSMRSRPAPIQFIDVAVFIVGFWTMISFTMNYGFEVGVVRGAGVTIDTALSYFVARTCIKSFDDLRYFLVLMLPALMIAGIALVTESLLGRLIVRPTFASLFGTMSAFQNGETSGMLKLVAEYRIGLMRAYGPFPHPILAGIMMIGFLPLYYFSSLRSWPLICGLLIPLTGFFGLSSAAFLALIVAFGVIAIYHVKAYVPRVSWWTISSLFVLLLWALHMASKSGIISVISRLTLTPDTAQYRLGIWEWGIKNIARNPWFGIGYKQWERLSWMGESVDAHFLLLAMRHGLVVPITMLCGILYSMMRLGMIIPYLAPQDRKFGIGINSCMIMFVIVGQTVNYFGSSNIFFMSVTGFLASAVVWGDLQMKTGKRALMRMQRARISARAIV